MALNLNFPQGRIGRLGLISLVLFILTIPLGNWVVTNVGLVCDPHGPCLIPVWPGVWSPSAVMVAGLALVLRDAVQSILGNLWAVAAIAAGALLSYLLADPAVVLGSTAAFLFLNLLILLFIRRCVGAIQARQWLCPVWWVRWLTA